MNMHVDCCRQPVGLTLALLVCAACAVRAATPVDERPGGPGEWGFRPLDGAVTAVSPPGFCWRPQRGASGYTLQCSPSRAFEHVSYEAAGIAHNVHRPPRAFEEGTQ